MQEIPSRNRDNPPVYRSESATTLKGAAEEAVSRGADLTRADLTGADLTRAVLRGAVLKRAYLTGAVLRWADLRKADLTGSDLRGADLTGADLTGADLRGAKMNWASHTLMVELLRPTASESVSRRMVAGLILFSRDWCWADFLQVDSFEKGWALDALAAHAVGDPDAPECLKERVVRLAIAEASGSPDEGAL